MPATVTLSTTSLAAGAGASDSQIKASSTSGLTPGVRLFCDGELMEVVSLGVSPWVNVRRGVDGTSAAAHPQMALCYIGRAYQFYGSDPVGAPAPQIPVSPYINAINGAVWFAKGDSGPQGISVRWWQRQSTTYGTGPLGIRTTTLDPVSSD
jgi:hypothetical protein